MESDYYLLWECKTGGDGGVKVVGSSNKFIFPPSTDSVIKIVAFKPKAVPKLFKLERKKEKNRIADGGAIMADDRKQGFGNKILKIIF